MDVNKAEAVERMAKAAEKFNAVDPDLEAAIDDMIELVTSQGTLAELPRVMLSVLALPQYGGPGAIRQLEQHLRKDFGCPPKLRVLMPMNDAG